MLLQTDETNLVRPGRRWEVEGREPEVEEDLRTGWVTVQGKRECQVETETEEMKTPEARRKLDPVPSPPRRIEWGTERWKEMSWEELLLWDLEARKWEGKEGRRKWEEKWERERQAGQKS